jgi:hypothetical protein
VYAYVCLCLDICDDAGSVSVYREAVGGYSDTESNVDDFPSIPFSLNNRKTVGLERVPLGVVQSTRIPVFPFEANEGVVAKRIFFLFFLFVQSEICHITNDLSALLFYREGKRERSKSK